MAFKIGFLERYRANHEWETIQKSRPVKYIRRYPKKSGKGWNYVYEDSWKHPLKALIECFGIKQKKIDDDYANNNIKEDYGADKQTFSAHVLEYFTNKVKWDNLFSKKEKRDKYKKPVTQKAVEAKAAAVFAEKKEPKAKNTDKMTVNRSLMHKVWSIYSVEGHRIDVAENHNENNSDFVNDLEEATHAYNKKVLNRTSMLKKDVSAIYRFANASTNEVDGYNSLDEYVAQLSKWNAEHEKAGVSERYDITKAGRAYAKIANKETARKIVEDYKNGLLEADENGILQKRKTAEILCFELGEEVSVNKRLSTVNARNVYQVAVKGLNAEKLSDDDLMSSLTAITCASYALRNNKRSELYKKTKDLNLLNQAANIEMQKKVEAELEKRGITFSAESEPDKTTIEFKKRDTSKLSEAMKGNQNAKGNKGGDGGNGNSGNIFKFSSLTNKEKEELGKKITDSIVSEIGKDTVAYNEAESVAELARKWIKNNPQGNAHSFIGDVIINEKSVERDMHHGSKKDSYLKLQTLPSVKDILEKGTYLGYEKDFDGKPIDNHYFSGKIKYGDDEKIVFCRVRENAGDESRFYVHEVFTEDEIKKEATMRTSNPSSLRLTGKPLYSFILQDVLKVKEKPQSDTQMKAEKEISERERENVGLPKVREELGERTSLVDDLSWNPNDENYRYKDTGYITGARKELALSQIRRAGRNKERLRDTDIDWEGIEENKRAAKEVITKSNIFGQVDWDSLKETGMTGGAAFLIDRVYSMIGKEPAEDSAEARRAYVIGVNGLRDRLESAKTVQDVENALREIGEEMEGRFHSVRDTDEYKERAKKVADFRQKVRELKEKDHTLFEAYNHEEYAAKSRADERIRKYLADKKVIRWNQKWWGDKELDKLNTVEKAKFREFQEQVKKEEFAKYNELFAERMKFLEDNGHLKRPQNKYVYPSGSWTYIDFPIEKEMLDAEQNLEIWEKIQGAAAMLENPLYKAWEQLGDKFKVITQHSYRSKTFYQHKADARRGNYDDWEWLKKDTVEVSKKGRERKANFEFIVAEEFNRKGGRNVTAKSTQELKELFNLRDVQSGNWVLKDPESAKWHVDRMTEAFADLCDVTGIPDNLVSLNGRLAVAIGARGTGGEGAAKAHYEPIQRVINITKMKGGGSLGHEWFHAFDNMIMEAMGGTEGQTSSFMTNKYAHLSPTQKKLLQDYLAEKENIKNGIRNWSSEYTVAKLKKACEKKGIAIPESPKEEFQVKVASAFDRLVEAMTKGNVPLFEKLTYSESDWDSAKYNIIKQKEGSSSYTFGNKIYDAGSFEKAMQIINERFDNNFSKNRLEWARMAAAFYNGKPENKYNTVPADLGHKGTDFLQKATLMDIDKSKDYWSSTHEMAARAFSAYLDDKLREQNRFNDYLANYTENKYYKSSLGDSYPFPDGEERKNINEAFKKLFDVIAEEKAIRKSLDLINADILSKSVNSEWEEIENTAEKRKSSKKADVQKSWCYFGRKGNLYFRKTAF